jgi:NhaP-type Na+/H+ or K+/H+ antiporter
MTVFLLAAGAVLVSFGFLLGWAARWAIVDLERIENAEDEDLADMLPFPERPGA